MDRINQLLSQDPGILPVLLRPGQNTICLIVSMAGIRDPDVGIEIRAEFNHPTCHLANSDEQRLPSVQFHNQLIYANKRTELQEFLLDIKNKMYHNVKFNAAPALIVINSFEVNEKENRHSAQIC
ncbi:MAG: hypothetical protein BWY82_00614 [Verrucomicrobia bacterium ADurb.Bin474]|nr:MAG: hypothetical protein BWY82_00614 [Verrucomicrobia bacterium ADurb.Bin474]